MPSILLIFPFEIRLFVMQISQQHTSHNLICNWNSEYATYVKIHTAVHWQMVQIMYVRAVPNDRMTLLEEDYSRTHTSSSSHFMWHFSLLIEIEIANERRADLNKLLVWRMYRRAYLQWRWWANVNSVEWVISGQWNCKSAKPFDHFKCMMRIKTIIMKCHSQWLNGLSRFGKLSADSDIRKRQKIRCWHQFTIASRDKEPFRFIILRPLQMRCIWSVYSECKIIKLNFICQTSERNTCQ